MSHAVLKKQCANSTTRKEAGSRTNAMLNASQCTTCEIRIEECGDGCKIYCTCDDQSARKALQNICRTLDGGCCRVCCTCDGDLCCECCFAGCDCKCEMLTDGVCICCTTTDKACLTMVAAMCRCLSACRECGCECTVCINEKPVCRCEC